MRQTLQQLPGGPDESSRIARVKLVLEQHCSKAAALEAKSVPRPIPSQYLALCEEVTRFTSAIGSVNRIMALMRRLQVRNGPHVQALLCVMNEGAMLAKELACLE